MKANVIICRRLASSQARGLTAYLKNGDGKVKTFASREGARRHAEIIGANAGPNVSYEAAAIHPYLATTERW